MLRDLHQLCIHLAMMPISSTLDESYLDDFIKEIFPDRDLKEPFFEKLKGFDRVEITTTTSNRLNLSIFDKAKLYVKEVEEPLVLDLRAGHPANPVLPEQLFKANERGFTSIPNPYINGSSVSVLNDMIGLYIAFCCLTGIPKNTNFTYRYIHINSINIDVINERIDCIYEDTLFEHLEKNAINEMALELEQNIETYISQFVSEFIPGMHFKTKQSLEPVKGERYLRNTFKPVEWSEDELDRPVEEFMVQLSMYSREDCPAYITHYERLKPYIEKWVISLLSISFPLNKEEHGINAKDYDDFKRQNGLQVFEGVFYARFIELLALRKLTLGKLINMSKKNQYH